MSTIRQIIQVIPVGIVLIGAKIFSVGAVDDMDPGFWTVRPVYPVFMDAHLDIAYRIGLRTWRPHLPAVAQARDIAVRVFAGLANITFSHNIFLSVGSFLMSCAGHCCPAPWSLLVRTLSQRRSCCCFCSLARIRIAQHFRCRRSRFLARHFRITFPACHFLLTSFPIDLECDSS